MSVYEPTPLLDDHDRREVWCRVLDMLDDTLDVEDKTMGTADRLPTHRRERP